MARKAIEANGGTLAKFIGDGVMALFGVPEVGEDDAMRAVRTGVELQHRFTPFGDRITQRHGVEVGLRVGINTGELVVADHDDDIVGDAVNTAARLEAECVPGRVLVGEDTWRLTRSAVQFEVLGEVSVKGKQEPIATFQVVDETSADDEMLTPFVGRDREVEALRAEFELTSDEQSARLATVIGAPGVGKTRLSRELGASGGRWRTDLRGAMRARRHRDVRADRRTPPGGHRPRRRPRPSRDRHGDPRRARRRRRP